MCDTDQKEITIDETYCWSVDHLGRPIDIYSEADYRMQVKYCHSCLFIQKFLFNFLKSGLDTMISGYQTSDSENSSKFLPLVLACGAAVTYFKFSPLALAC